MFDHPIEKDCLQICPVRQVAGPENAVIQNLAALHCTEGTKIFLESATKAKIHNIYLKLYYALNRGKIKIPHNDHPAAA